MNLEKNNNSSENITDQSDLGGVSSELENYGDVKGNINKAEDLEHINNLDSVGIVTREVCDEKKRELNKIIEKSNKEEIVKEIFLLSIDIIKIVNNKANKNISSDEELQKRNELQKFYLYVQKLLNHKYLPEKYANKMDDVIEHNLYILNEKKDDYKVKEKFSNEEIDDLNKFYSQKFTTLEDVLEFKVDYPVIDFEGVVRLEMKKNSKRLRDQILLDHKVDTAKFVPKGVNEQERKRIYELSNSVKSSVDFQNYAKNYRFYLEGSKEFPDRYKEVNEFFCQYLRGSSLIDLGSGEALTSVMYIYKMVSRFNVKELIAVDKYIQDSEEEFERMQMHVRAKERCLHRDYPKFEFVKKDMLKYLVDCNEPANFTINGIDSFIFDVFSENNAVEYIKEVFEQIARLTPPKGIVFGINNHFSQHLSNYGFKKRYDENDIGIEVWQKE